MPCDTAIDYKLIIAILAVIVSLIALYFSVIYFSRNIRSSIQQSIFKTVSEKAKDCNLVWISEPKPGEGENESPHYKVMTELVISREVIDKAFDIFGYNQHSIIKFKNDYYYLLYKQLDPRLRDWFKRTPEIADRLESEFGEPQLYYKAQIADMFAAFKKHFEKIL
jgi:hypothetical protein